MTTARSVAALTILFFAAGCTPTAQDEAMMDRMLSYEAGQAAIIEADATNCAKLETDLKAYTVANQASHQEVNAWWDGLNRFKRKKLSEKSKGSMYRLAMAMMKAPGCSAQIKSGMKG